MYTDFLSPSRSLGSFLPLPARSKPARQAKAKTAAQRGVRKQSKIRPRVRKPRYLGSLTGRGRTKNSTHNPQVMPLPMREEYIGAVTVANEPNFNCVSYAINPGNSTTFPWASTIAKQFEKYRFRYLEFIYKREVSEYATNGQVGKIMLGVDFDASDAPPTTKQQLEDTDPHCDGLPSENVSLVIPSKQLNRFTDGFYVRPGILPGSSDIKTFDVGNLNVATQGIVNNVEIGELHVRYQLELFVPVLESTAAAPTNNSVAWFQSTGTEASAATGVAKTLLLATTVANGIGIVNTSGSIVPAPGNYLVDITNMAGNTTTAYTTVMDLKKNGTSVFTASTIPTCIDGGSGTNPLSVIVPASLFVTANGSDAFTLVCTNTFGGGTMTNCGSARWTAI